MKKRLNFWDILAWVALGSIVLWTILKITGIINTPLLIEYYPILAASYAFGWQMHKLSNVAEDVGELKNFRSETIKQIHSVKENCARNHR